MSADPAGRPAVGDEQRRPESALFAIKAVHSVAFLVELGAIMWLVVTGFVGRRDRSVVVAGALVAVEAGVFVANDGVCPLTPLAERYGARRGSVSDIFLPDALARTIPIWSTALVATAILLHGRAAIVERSLSRDARTDS